jgi:hypothetical protein
MLMYDDDDVTDDDVNAVSYVGNEYTTSIIHIS